MWKFIILICLSIGVSQSQLNFEGNPLTENTDYTAEETHYLPRHDAGKSKKFDVTNDSGIDTYLAAANSLTRLNNSPLNIQDPVIDVESLKHQPQSLMNANKVNRIMGTTTYDMSDTSPNSVNGHSSASISPNKTLRPRPRLISSDPLNSFLNSRTPEESQLSLDHYLKSQQQQQQSQSQSSPQSPSSPQTDIHNLEIINQKTENNQNMQSNVPQYLSNQPTSLNSLENIDNINQAQLPGRAVIPHQNGQIINPQVYQTHPLASPLRPQMTYQSRRDMPMARRRPIYHQRGVPARYRNKYRAQSKIGPGFIKKLTPPFGPPHGPLIYPGDEPIEVIYTKPPGFSHGSPPIISNPPVTYENTDEFFPDNNNHPPVNKDAYYSQLWAQSYDPHYYNYIAKTGKIKPWLYGKLGKQEEKGFWHELYLSFQNHGMKNMLNPMFLLGLSIPTVTLMLSAMVGKRSLGRSDNDGNYYLSDEKITELAETVRRAIECYENQTACFK